MGRGQRRRRPRWGERALAQIGRPSAPLERPSPQRHPRCTTRHDRCTQGLQTLCTGGCRATDRRAPAHRAHSQPQPPRAAGSVHSCWGAVSSPPDSGTWLMFSGWVLIRHLTGKGRGLHMSPQISCQLYRDPCRTLQGNVSNDRGGGEGHVSSLAPRFMGIGKSISAQGASTGRTGLYIKQNLTPELPQFLL